MIIDPLIIRKQVEELTSFNRSYSSPASLAGAAKWIASQFEKYGLIVESQEFEVQGNVYQNIIARLGTGKKIIVGAHYDTFRDYPGADDNASGVIGVIEVAKYLKRFESELEYQYEFVCYALEEPPFFRTKQMGSFFHASSLKNIYHQIEAMVCLEMIGYFSDKEKSQTYPSSVLNLFYPSVGDFIAVVSNFSSRKIRKKMKKGILQYSDVKCCSIISPRWLQGVDFSDHLNYWNQGIKAIMITDTAFFRNPHYHQKTDIPSTLDYERMAQVIFGVAKTLQNW